MYLPLDFHLHISLAAPYVASLVSPLLSKIRKNMSALTTVLSAVLSLIIINYYWFYHGEGLVKVEWIPSVELYYIVRLDSLSYLFAILILGIGAVVAFYSNYYIKVNHGRYYMFLSLFMGSMLGLVLAGDLISLFMFWELTTVSSFLLIGFNKEESKSQSSAFKALLITGLGGLSLLASLILINITAGTYEIEKIIRLNSTITSSAIYIPILLFFIVGVISKSAQFPLHIWLPDAMVAPTPISAYLHSAAMVKAGIYLLARFAPALSSIEWQSLLYVIGITTSLLGGLHAIRSTELKRILAYSTVSQLGLLVWAFSSVLDVSQKAGLLHIISHALAKASLFLVVGVVTHATGINDIRNLGGLGKRMPLTATAAAISSLSLAGLPPTLGFQSKELLFEASLKNLYPITSILITASSSLTFAYIFYFFSRIFLMGKTSSNIEEPMHLAVPALILSISSVLAALSPSTSLALVYTIVYGPGFFIDMKFTTEGISMSLASAVIGLIIIKNYQKVSSFVDAINTRLQSYSIDNYYESFVGSLNKVAARIGLLIQNGSIRRYSFLFLAFVTLAFSPSFSFIGIRAPTLSTMEDIPIVGILLGMVTLAGFATFFNNIMYAILSLSGMGFLLAVTFMILKAPDLAMTQIVVEIVFIIFMLIVVYKIPMRAIKKQKSPTLSDALLSIAIAIGATIIISASLSNNYYQSDAYFFLDPSKVKLTGGKNIVNIILVDFRGFDTWGEITVLVLAALASYTLLRRWKHD